MGRIFKAVLTVVISSSLIPVIYGQTASGTNVAVPAISRLPLGPQELAGGFWRTDHDFKPTLQITNVLSIAPLTVTPVLYMADGTPYSLGAYELAVSGVVAIDLRAALEEAPAAIASHVSDYGSVRVQYEWRWANAITASVQNIDVPRSLDFTFELRTPPLAAINTNSTSSVNQEKHGDIGHSGHDKVRGIIEEGLWWKRDPGVEGFVALTNISSNALPVSLELLGRHGEVSARRRLILGPEITQVLQLSDLDPEKLIHANAGGVRIQYTGTTHDLVAVGGLENGEEGYSANIPFGILANKPNPGDPVSISAAGVMVGAPDPMMMFPAGTVFTPYIAMRNTSNHALIVASSVSYMDGAGAKSIALAPIKLLPGEARDVSGNDLLAPAGLMQFNGIVNLGFAFQGDGNDLLLATGSVDQKGTYVLPVEATGDGDTESKWLKYWSLANGDDTMISLFNPGKKPEDLQMTLFFMDGQYKIPVHLDAKGSTMVMLGEIIAGQQPDPDGHTIPFFIHQGSAILSSAAGMDGKMNVSVSSSIFNVANATCGTTCPTCLGYTNFFVSPTSASTTVNGSLKFTAFGVNTSNGFDDKSVLANWSSTNSQVGSSQGGGSFNALKAGSFLATASINLIDPNADCPEGQRSPCPTSFWEASGQGDVTPTINSISPSSGTAGNTTHVTISGTGLNSAAVSIQPGTGITIQNLSAGSSTQITADFAIAASAAAGNRSVTVQSGGETSNSATFNVIVPNHLVVQSDLITTSNACPAGNAVFRKIQYQIVGQGSPGQPVGNIPIQELFTNLNPTTCGNPDATPSVCSTGYVNASSIFEDDLSTNACSPANQSCGFSLTPDHWQWCPSGQTPTTIGSPTYVIDWNRITINGSATPLGAGTVINP